MTADPARHLLLTGFEPFDGDTVNPSGEVAKQLDGRVLGGSVVRSVVLPVQHEAARTRVAPLLEAPGLSAVVHLGLAGGRARIALERVAVNVMTTRGPTRTGRCCATWRAWRTDRRPTSARFRCGTCWPR